MPVDFRTYQDPGTYVEVVNPPVVFTPGLEPTTLAIVGPSSGYKLAGESLTLAGVNPVDAIQTVTITGSPISGNFTLSFRGVLSGNIPWNSIASVVQTALETVSTIGVGNVVVTGGPGPATPWVVRFAGALGSQVLPDIVAANVDLSTGSIAAATTQAGAPANLLNTLGITLSSLKLTDRNDGSSRVSGLIGTLNVAVTSTSATTMVVNEANTPLGTPFTILVDSEQMSVTGRAIVTGNQYTYTVTRATGGTVAQTHLVSQAVNFGTLFTNTDIGTIATPLDATTSTVVVTETTPSPTAPFYIDVEGERMRVATKTNTSPTWTYTNVVRGVGGTTAAAHGTGAPVKNSTGADYMLVVRGGADNVIGTGSDDIVTVGRITSGNTRIVDGGGVYANFRTTDANYYDAIQFDDMDNVRIKYGDPFNADGTLNSSLSLAAQLAFNNGSTQIVVAPVRGTGAGGSVTNADWTTALGKLEDNQLGVDIVVPLSGDNTNLGPLDLTRSHVRSMAIQGSNRRCFLGLDGFSTALTVTNFVNYAGQLNDERVSLVGPGRFTIDTGAATPLNAPGYYAAVAVAGRASGLGPQEPLTRKQIFGLSLPLQDTNANMLTMQKNGVLYLWLDRNGAMLVRHGLTTNMTNVYTREISIITARDRLRDLILDTMEGSGLLGSTISAETPSVVVASVEGALEFGKSIDLIADYSDVKFRFPTENATVIEVRFAYQPSLPLNYIHVQFSIDTTSGSVDFESINDSTDG